MWISFGDGQEAKLSRLLQGLADGTLCDASNPSNLNLSEHFTREPNNELQYFSWNMAWHCLNITQSRPESRFNRWDSSESNPICPLSWPTTLTYNESANSKPHEMYSQGNSLLKSIQTIWPYVSKSIASNIIHFAFSKTKVSLQREIFQWIGWQCRSTCSCQLPGDDWS